MYMSLARHISARVLMQDPRDTEEGSKKGMLVLHQPFPESGEERVAITTVKIAATYRRHAIQITGQPDIQAGHTRAFDSPMEEGLALTPDDCPTPGSPEHADMASRRETYMSIVGGILWLANMTRSDVAYPASQLARYLSNPSMRHFNAAVRVLIYLDGTRGRLLTFAPNQKLGFEAYVDSSWATKFSCSGALFFYHGCPFHKVLQAAALCIALKRRS